MDTPSGALFDDVQRHEVVDVLTPDAEVLTSRFRRVVGQRPVDDRCRQPRVHRPRWRKPANSDDWPLL